MSACACMGPPGDCPCIRAARGLKVDVSETYINPDVFACLPDEDKKTINELKDKAFALFMAKHSRSQKLKAAGYTVRDTRIPCEDCGKLCTPQLLPIHNCPMRTDK